MLLRSKIAAFAGAGALLVASVVPSFASGPHWWNWHVNTTTNNAEVTTNTSSSASTGSNYQKSKGGDSNQTIYTGDAGASADSLTVVNAAAGCGCESKAHHTRVTNNADVVTNTSSNASTGSNTQKSRVNGDEYWWSGTANQTTGTGDANARSSSMTFVNVSLPSFSF